MNTILWIITIILGVIIIWRIKVTMKSEDNYEDSDSKFSRILKNLGHGCKKAFSRC